MALTRVLIKFIADKPVGNVITACALDPEIVIPVGYTGQLTESMRGRYNYFFHHRGLRCVMTGIYALERFRAAEMEERLAALLEKYAEAKPVIDVRDADETQAIALGAVLKSHRLWDFQVIDYRIEDSTFIPLINADSLRRVSFPSLTASEMAFLRKGTPFDAPLGGGEEILLRKDLVRQTVRDIRILSKLYRSAPDYWISVSARLKASMRNQDQDRIELIMDASRLLVEDEALEKLMEAGYLDAFIRKSGIVYLKFPDAYALRLFLHVDSVPLFEIFLETAFIREYGKSAAYHDLTLYGWSIVTGIRRAMPVVLGSLDSGMDVKDIYLFDAEARKQFDEPLRKYLVREPDLFIDETLRNAAEDLSIQFVTLKQLTDVLEPR